MTCLLMQRRRTIPHSYGGMSDNTGRYLSCRPRPWPPPCRDDATPHLGVHVVGVRIHGSVHPHLTPVPPAPIQHGPVGDVSHGPLVPLGKVATERRRQVEEAATGLRAAAQGSGTARAGTPGGGRQPCSTPQNSRSSTPPCGWATSPLGGR